MSTFSLVLIEIRFKLLAYFTIKTKGVSLTKRTILVRQTDQIIRNKRTPGWSVYNCKKKKKKKKKFGGLRKIGHSDSILLHLKRVNASVRAYNIKFYFKNEMFQRN